LVEDGDILFVPDSAAKTILNKTMESAIQSAIGILDLLRAGLFAEVLGDEKSFLGTASAFRLCDSVGVFAGPGRTAGQCCPHGGAAAAAGGDSGVLQAGRVRVPGALQWVTMAFYLWLCCSYFWTIEPLATLDKMRAYFQETMIVWLVWEFAESPRDLRWLLRAYVAGSWVLAALTLANFGSMAAIAAGQIRFVAYGQDPNDVARYLDLWFSAGGAAAEQRAPLACTAAGDRLLAAGPGCGDAYGFAGGFLAALVALAGCGILLFRGHAKAVLAGAFALPALAASLWFIAPHGTLARLATIPEQIRSGDLNRRLDIWSAGWDAFTRAPLLGTGAGSFCERAGLSSVDTAHKCSFFHPGWRRVVRAVSGGWHCGVGGAVGLQNPRPLKLALVTTLLVWVLAAMVSTVEESRTTWLLIALIAVAGRLAVEEPAGLAACFPISVRKGRLGVIPERGV